MLQELKSWCKESKKDIFWTFAGAILSTALGLICQHLIPQTSTQDVGKSADLKGVPEGLQTIIRYLSISDFTNYAIQAVFVIVAIVILILSRRDTIRDLNNKELIVNYMMDNCNVRVYTNDDNEVRYNRIKTTTNLFYGTWLLVWTLWFCYYLGNFIFSFSLEFNYPPYMRDGIKLCETIYSQIFDYLTNTVLLFMYLVLTDIDQSISCARQ